MVTGQLVCGDLDQLCVFVCVLKYILTQNLREAVIRPLDGQCSAGKDREVRNHGIKRAQI